MKAIYGDQRQALLYAYLAGIIDGEGTIRINKTRLSKYPNWQDKYSAHISVGMSSKKVIDLLVKNFKARMRIERAGVPNRKTIYRWGTSGNKAVPKILKKILPYLIAKKKHAELVIEFCEGYKKGIDSIRPCRKCKQDKIISGYGLCHTCYMQERRKNTLERYKRNYRRPQFLPIKELQRREELYQRVRKLNAVGAAAETEQEHA